MLTLCNSQNKSNDTDVPIFHLGTMLGYTIYHIPNKIWFYLSTKANQKRAKTEKQHERTESEKKTHEPKLPNRFWSLKQTAVGFTRSDGCNTQEDEGGNRFWSLFNLCLSM